MNPNVIPSIKKKVKRYAKDLFDAGKTMAKFIGAVATEPFTNRYVNAVTKQMQDNPPASPRYGKKAWGE